MKGLLFFFLICLSAFNADEIKFCKDYNQISSNAVGKSPPLNMMMESIRGNVFPVKISKKDEAFKKLSSIENLLEKSVDLVVLWNSKANYNSLHNQLSKVNIDACAINLDSIYDYVDGYKTLGKIMNKEERGKELSSYLENKLQEIKTIRESVPQDERLSVYYARSANGLESDCENSSHSEVIELIGARNPIKCNKIKNARVNINLEKLFLLNPDVIITSSAGFFKKIFKENKYKYLNAVKEKKVYLIPTTPINWIDNPPSFFKILGALWLGQKVYPNYYTYDFEAQKKDFFKLFLQEGKL